MENSIDNNYEHGIFIELSSNCSIRSNIFSYNEDYGIYLGFDTHSITVTRNDFIENNIVYVYLRGTSQACDDGEGNIFKENYWNDWTGPDNNGDGFVDDPYEIDGEANNVDYFPLTTSISTPPKLFIPLNIITGVIFLILILGTIAILQLKNRK